MPFGFVGYGLGAALSRHTVVFRKYLALHNFLDCLQESIG
jgi:hypothetical protein